MDALPSNQRDAAAAPVPSDAEGVRAEVSSRRWRLYATVGEILAELESKVDWEKLYDEGASLDELLSWGLFLEEALPGVVQRIRSIADEAEAPGGRPEASPEELEDHLYWGSKQLESGMQQPLSVLSREMVSLIAGAGTVLEGEAREAKKRALSVPVAELLGKLKSELRKLTAFLVAGETWDANEIELLLFPQKREELEKGKGLKQRLVETMEGFQGSESRMPISDVLHLWRRGRVLGPAALAEIDQMLRSLGAMLDKTDRRALYVDSYYRLQDWIRRLERSSDGLKSHLGDEEVEAALIKEVAAILDTETLAEILGEESLEGLVLPRDLPELLRFLNKRELGKLELKKAEQNRLLELKAQLQKTFGGGGWEDLADYVALSDEEESLLRSAVAKIKGKKLVDQLRIRARLPETLLSLEHLHELVLEAEEGLKTYLILLYGQIQNRDLHLLEEDQQDVSLPEKRLAVSELEYRLARLQGGDSWQAFEAVCRRIADGEEVGAEEWEGLYELVGQLGRVILPRLERVAGFAEVTGVPEGATAELRQALNELVALEEPPPAERTAEVAKDLARISRVVQELENLSIVSKPPETVDEIEDFLNMMG